MSREQKAEQQVSDIKKPEILSNRDYKIEIEEKARKRLQLRVKITEGTEYRGVEAVLQEIEHRLGYNLRCSKVNELKEDIRISTWSLKDKKGILKNKYKMKGSNIWINEEWTPRERLIHRWLKQTATRRNKGSEKIQVGYMKTINSLSKKSGT